MRKLIKSIGLPIIFGLLAGLLVLLVRPELAGISEYNRDRLLTRAERIFNISGRVSYSDAVKRATPAVVNISTKSSKNLSNQQQNSPNKAAETSLGSGVIVHPNGFILTNNHVIQGLERIIVALRDGREMPATVVGTDPETDLALLRIGLDNLPYLNLVDSSEAEIGDVVLAIGNPFGLGQTVTMGIISATGRNDLQLNIYEDFIQTDAAINVGNSGGALVNAYGDLVGISTLLYSRGGGSEGVGFAIPSNMARFVMTSIVKYGRVVRGWLGIESQPLSASLAKAYGVSANIGILISGVYEGGPAEKAGLRRGDILTGINDQSTSDGRKVMNVVAQIPPGEMMTMQILRDGKEMSLTGQVATRPHIVNN
ncbi:2-alkenal reductase [Endozoicomonas sp. (ex Bugula neritina AB1)]|nr:2-alkenal reductase [Endozoicomonas sp. (ex Bugula neritina AB1)]